MATQVASLYAKIGASTDGFDRAMRGVDDKLHSVGGAFGKFGNVVTDVFKIGAVAAIGATTAAIAGLTAVVVKSTQSAADMEQQVANIAAVMGLTADETDKVSGLINSLGLDPNLKVSAVEAGQAIEMLAKNGLSLDQIMAGAARSTVLLSNSTGGDFAAAADTATSAMMQFGIDAKDMTQAVNQIVGVTNVSKFGFEDYSLALAQAGGVAASVGVSFEDFNATIAAISPLFASGSDAGTSYKTFLQRLIPQSDAAAGAMQRLGLFSGLTSKEFEDVSKSIQKTKDKIAKLDPTSKTYAKRLEQLTGELNVLEGSLVSGQNAFFDSNGQMKSMADIAGILNKAFAGLSEEQKNEAASTIFGTDAMRAAFAIAGITTEQFQSLKNTIGDTSAEDAASTRMATFSGKMEIFRGVLEAVSIGIGQKFLPMATRMMEWATSFLSANSDKIIDWFGQLADGVAAFGMYLAAVMQDGDAANDWLTHLPEALQPAVKGLGEFVGAMRRVWEAFQTGGAQGALAQIGAEFAAFGATIKEWATGLWTDSIQPGIEWTWGEFVKWLMNPAMAQTITDNLLRWSKAFFDWAGGLWNEIVWPKLTEFWGWLTSWLTEPAKRQQLIDSLWIWSGIFWDWGQSVWTTYVKPGMDNLWRMFSGPGGWLETNAPVMKPWVDALTTFIGEVKTQWGLQFPAVAEQFTTWKGDMAIALGEFAAVWAGVFGDGSNPGSAAEAAKKTVEVITQSMTDMMNGSLGLVKWATNIGKVVQLLKQLIDAIDAGDWGRAGDLFNQIDKIPITGGNFFNPLNPLAPPTNPDAPFFGQSDGIGGGGGTGRLDLYVHSGAGMPADRETIRSIAVALRRELDLTGAVMIR